MMSRLCLFVLLLGVASIAKADMEIEIEFRLQPDSTGGNTRNQGIKIEDDEAEIYLDGRERDIDAAKVDSKQLFELVETSVQNFKMEEGKRVRPPYVEVKMEFSGEDREIEVSYSYPSGEVPAELVKLQEKYLDEVWK